MGHLAQFCLDGAQEKPRTVMARGFVYIYLENAGPRGISPSTKLLPSQKFVWAPARGAASLPHIAPPFESSPESAQALSLGP